MTVALVKSASSVFLVALLISLGCRGPGAMSETSAVMSGILYVTGNEPFTHLSLQTDDGRMHEIDRDSTLVYGSLWKLQGHKVRAVVRLAGQKRDSSLIIIERFDLVKDQ
jgi:hypothetical protein